LPVLFPAAALLPVVLRSDEDRVDRGAGPVVRSAPRAAVDAGFRPALDALRPAPLAVFRVGPRPAGRRRALPLPRETSLMNRLSPRSWIKAASRRESNVSNH
jgi:hypothetical protein